MVSLGEIVIINIVILLVLCIFTLSHSLRDVKIKTRIDDIADKV